MGSGGRRSCTFPCPGPRPSLPLPVPVPSARPYSGLRQADSRCRLAHRHLTPLTSPHRPCPRRASSPAPSRRMMDGGACCCVVTRRSQVQVQAPGARMVLWGTRLSSQRHSRNEGTTTDMGARGGVGSHGGRGRPRTVGGRTGGRTVLVEGGGEWWWLAWCIDVDSGWLWQARGKTKTTI